MRRGGNYSNGIPCGREVSCARITGRKGGVVPARENAKEKKRTGTLSFVSFITKHTQTVSTVLTLLNVCQQLLNQWVLRPVQLCFPFFLLCTLLYRFNVLSGSKKRQRELEIRHLNGTKSSSWQDYASVIWTRLCPSAVSFFLFFPVAFNWKCLVSIIMKNAFALLIYYSAVAPAGHWLNGWFWQRCDADYIKPIVLFSRLG